MQGIKPIYLFTQITPSNISNTSLVIVGVAAWRDKETTSKQKDASLIPTSVMRCCTRGKCSRNLSRSVARFGQYCIALAHFDGLSNASCFFCNRTVFPLLPGEKLLAVDFFFFVV